jgi:hypothetical protein
MFAEREEDKKKEKVTEPTKEIKVDRTRLKEIIITLKTKPPDEEKEPTKEESQKQNEEKIRNDFWKLCQSLAEANRKNKDSTPDSVAQEINGKNISQEKEKTEENEKPKIVPAESMYGEQQKIINGKEPKPPTKASEITALMESDINEVHEAIRVVTKNR